MRRPSFCKKTKNRENALAADSPIPTSKLNEAAFVASLARLLGDEKRLALAVSGGSDSTALLLLAAKARSALNIEIVVATVDHGLRNEARAEAEAVASLCEALGASHEILTWRGQKPTANLQAASREARSRLLAEWRRRLGVRTLALGHTLDDVAETFLIRLARGSGVDGLARMAEAGEQTELDDLDGAPLRLIRPLLDFRRDDLRAYCRSHGVGWAEDPSNEDNRFTRTQARQALKALSALELGPERLAKTAASMARAREALEAGTSELLQRAAEIDPTLGLVRLQTTPLAQAPRELALRALARALEWVSGARYPPRFEALEAALEAILRGEEGRTLHGAMLARCAQGRSWVLHREPAAMDAACDVNNGEAVWDGRFRLRCEQADVSLGALGEEGRLTVEAEARRRNETMPAPWRAAPIEARRTAPAALQAGGKILFSPAAGVFGSGFEISPVRAVPWRRQSNNIGISVER